MLKDAASDGDGLETAALDFAVDVLRDAQRSGDIRADITGPEWENPDSDEADRRAGEIIYGKKRRKKGKRRG